MIADIVFAKEETDEFNQLAKLYQVHKKLQKLMIKAKLRRRSRQLERIKKQEARFLKDCEKYQAKQDKVKGSVNIQKIKHAYVVFRSMDAMSYVIKAYDYTLFQRLFFKLFPCCFPKRQYLIQSAMFHGNWLDVNYSGQPHEIQWQNVGVTGLGRAIRQFLVSLIAVVLILGGILGVVYMKNQAEFFKKDFKLDIECPVKVTKMQAYIDQQAAGEQRRGLMHCFCLNALVEDPIRGLLYTFNDINPQDRHRYCEDWFIDYAKQNLIIVGTSVLVIVFNVIICYCFELIAKLERFGTLNNETRSKFRRITVMQFINIAVILLLVNFRVEDMRELRLYGQRLVLEGDYRDFSTQWYFNIGATLCMTLFLNIFTPHVVKLLMPCKVCCSRCCDRGCCRCELKKKPHDASNDEVNTELIIQSELEQLYTGPQIASHYVYAQLFTNLWACLMYSSGLPMMYPIAMLFNIILYWVYKCLLLKFYQKTTNFNEKLVLDSISLVKYGIFFHLLIGIWMYSNSSILSTDNKNSLLESIKQYGVIKEELEYLQRRFNTTHSQLYLGCCVVVFVLVVVRHLFFDLAGNILVSLLTFSWLCSNKVSPEKSLRTQSDDLFKELNISALREYYKRHTYDLNSFETQTLNNKEHNEAQVEFVNKYLQLQNERKKAIEETIDFHHRHLLESKQPDPSLAELEERPKQEADVLNFPQKLTALLAHEPQLHQIYQTKGLPCLRMAGSIQSYFVLDSHQY